MPKTLLLLRHGKSDWKNENESDFNRPLAKRGIEAATRMGLYLDEHEELTPEVIYTSPAIRALRTAELIQEELTDVDLVEDESIYEADVDAMIEVIAGLPEDVDRVLIVGHNPTLEELADELTGRSDSVFKTCSLAVLRCKADDWSAVTRESCKLLSLLHPAEVGE